MLIIEGLFGKSVAIEQYLKGLESSETTLICQVGMINYDTRTIKPDLYRLVVEDEIDEFINKFKNNLYENKGLGFKNVVFYLHASREDIPKFKELESELGFNAVLVVQPPSEDATDGVVKYTL